MIDESKKPKLTAESPKAARKVKRPYQKPDFEHERVFETMALACGKVSSSQAQCRFNRKVS